VAPLQPRRAAAALRHVLLNCKGPIETLLKPLMNDVLQVAAEERGAVRLSAAAGVAGAVLRVLPPPPPPTRQR
jgi:hypothetical protein